VSPVAFENVSESVYRPATKIPEGITDLVWFTTDRVPHGLDQTDKEVASDLKECDKEST
jgi:hypothetical protein